jgi:NitT/TauT family transport system substrate-binding protein
MTRKRATALLLTASLAVGACAGGTPTPTPAVTPTPAGPPVATKCDGQRINFQLSFIPNVQHAGFLVASNRGYYEDEGLDVNVQPGGPNLDPTSAVGDGSAQVGQVDYGQLLRARAAGVPIVSIAQTYQTSFLNWFSSKDSGINTIADWKGKRVGVIQVGDDPEVLAMMAQAGLEPNDVEFVQQSFGIDDFVADKVDVGTGVVFFHPAMFNGTTDTKWPAAFNVFNPDEQGAPISSQTIATNEDMLANDPGALRCFLRASIRGWQAALEDPEAAVDDVMTFIPEGAIPRPHQAAAINDVLPIVASGPNDPGLLRIDPPDYQRSIDILTEVGFLETDVNVTETYDSSIYDTMGPVGGN